MNFAYNCNYFRNLVIKFIEFHCIVLFQAFKTLAVMIILKIKSTSSTSGKFNTCTASKGEREISRPISRVRPTRPFSPKGSESTNTYLLLRVKSVMLVFIIR